MTIKTTSGGTVGVKDSGTAFEYTIEKETFLKLVGTVFDREEEDYKPENVKAGGMVSQFLHAYGVSATKMEKSGLNPFPNTGGLFNGDNVDEWFKAIDFETPRQKRVAIPLEVRQAKWDATAKAMELAGLDKEFIEGAIDKRPVK